MGGKTGFCRHIAPLWVGLLTGLPLTAHALEYVSVDSDGYIFDLNVTHIIISHDGRFVAFDAFDEVVDQLNRSYRINRVYLRDRATRTTELVSATSQGEVSQGGSPVVSADGRYVAFGSRATNLVNNAPLKERQIFVKDRETGNVELISGNAAGKPSDGYNRNASMTADGRYVAFASTSSDLLKKAGSTQKSDVYLRDRKTGVIERISVNNAGEEGNSSTFNYRSEFHRPIALTDDGRYVAFSSDSDNLVPGDTNGSSDVFVRDRETGTTERVSIDGNGRQLAGESLGPSLSADGRYVAFVTYDSHDGRSHSEIYLRDRKTGTTEKISRNFYDLAGGLEARKHLTAAVGPNGRYVRFIVSPANTYFNWPVVYDRWNKTYELLVEGVNAVRYPSFSGDGNNFVFRYAKNLSPDDRDTAYDAYLYASPEAKTSWEDNQPPIAHAGADQSAMLCSGTTLGVVLDAGASLDPDGDDLNFHWNGPFGSASGQTVTVDLGAGSHDILLTVDDGHDATATDSVRVNVVADTLPPRLDAGEDVVLEATSRDGAPYTLSPSASDNCGQVAVSASPTPLNYPLGITEVTVTAEDSLRNSATDSLRISVVDSVAPLLISPLNDIKAERRGQYTMVSLGTPVFSDLFPVTVHNDAPAVGYPLGETVVTWTAADANGNSTSARQTVRVVDTTPPSLSVAPSFTFEATSADGVPLELPYEVADACGCAQVHYEPSPAYLGLGSHRITLVAVDDVGNETRKAVSVTVEDTTPPQLVAPGDLTVERSAPLTPVALGQPQVSDLFGVSVSNDAPAAGYPLGETVVIWIAVDANGNSTSARQTVRVVDTTPPSLSVAPSFTFEATSSDGVPLELPYEVADACGCAQVHYEPSPAYLGLGSHRITLVAVDDVGNETRKAVSVTVEDTTPPQLIVPGDLTVEATGILSPVPLGEALASDLFEVSVSNDAPAAFPLGSTMVIWTAVDANGNTTSARQTVTVQDTTPALFEFTQHYETVSASNHKLLKVAELGNVSDRVDASPAVDITIASNEADNGKGDGNTKRDWEVVRNGSVWEVWLRAERAGPLSGREYTIRAVVTDFSGNISAAEGMVTIPHDRGRRGGN